MPWAQLVIIFLFWNPRIPQWKEDQILNPGRWEVRIAVDPDPKLKWMSRISFNQYGRVGVDVKSHQTNTEIPYPVVTQGNDEQDSYCKCTNVKHRPPDIFLPSGGPLAFLCKDCRMIITIPHKFTRNLLRHQSSALMATKLTQGKLAKLKGLIYHHTLDILAFTSRPIPSHLEHLLLAEDQPMSVDLSGALFRMHRAVGGSWTEYLKTDDELLRLAEIRHTAAGLPYRMCPFCRVSQGTPRHYVMECQETEKYAEDICEAVDLEALVAPNL